MKKLVLRDRGGVASSFLLVENDQLEEIERGMADPVGFWCKHLGGEDFIGRGEIVRITAAGRDAPEPNDPNKRLKMPELTDEQRAANIAKFTKMRKNWEIMRVKKREAEEKAKQKARAAQFAKENKAKQKAIDDLHKFIEKQKREGKIKTDLEESNG